MEACETPLTKESQRGHACSSASPRDRVNDAEVEEEEEQGAVSQLGALLSGGGGVVGEAAAAAADTTTGNAEGG